MNISNLKLISLLESFQERDIKEFKKLISSAFFSKGRNYLTLLNLLLKYKKKGFEKVTVQSLYLKLYPGKSFNIQTLDKRFSELFKLAEEYLIHKTLSENPMEKSKILLIAYQDRKNRKLFKSQYKKSKSHLNSFSESDAKFFNAITLERLNISNSREHKISENIFREYFEHSETMTALFLKNLFLFGIEFIQQEQSNRSYGFNITLELLDRLKIDGQFLQNLEKSNLTIFRITTMLFYFYDIFKNPDNEQNYFKGKKIFDELKDSLDTNDIKELYKLMTSYCIMRQNQGFKKFQAELFNIYNEILKGELYFDNKYFFPPSTFRNCVLIGVILKKTKWTEDFIKKYSKDLPEENRGDEINLSYSKLFFSSKDYEKSLQHLKGFKGLNYLHYCDSSILKLCCYYETGRFEEAFSEIDKFKHYLRSHREIPKIHKEFSNNFLKIYQPLIKFKTGMDKKELYNAENLINKIKPVSRENWLTEKIIELK